MLNDDGGTTSLCSRSQATTPKILPTSQNPPLPAKNSKEGRNCRVRVPVSKSAYYQSLHIYLHKRMTSPRTKMHVLTLPFREIKGQSQRFRFPSPSSQQRVEDHQATTKHKSPGHVNGSSLVSRQRGRAKMPINSIKAIIIAHHQMQ